MDYWLHVHYQNQKGQRSLKADKKTSKDPKESNLLSMLGLIPQILDDH